MNILDEAALEHEKEVLLNYMKNNLETSNITSFKAGAEYMKQQMIEKTCEWLENNVRNYYSAYTTENKLIEDFKQAMK